MNIIKLAHETKALAEKATPKPWAINMGHREAKCDADFIDFTRTAAPQLADAVIEMVEALRFYSGWHQQSLDYQEWLNTPETPLNAVPSNTARELLTKLGIGGDNNG